MGRILPKNEKGKIISVLSIVLRVRGRAISKRGIHLHDWGVWISQTIYEV